MVGSGSPVFDVTEDLTGFVIDLESEMAQGLASATAYDARVRYQNAAGKWSAWSSVCSFTTDTAVLPNTPTVTATTLCDDTLNLLSGAFSHADTTRTHRATEWEVDTTGSGFASPDFQSLLDYRNLLTIPAIGLVAATSYEVRIRHMDDQGSFSAWSGTFTISTAATPANRPTTPTVTPGTPGVNSMPLTTGAWSDPVVLDTHGWTQWQVSRDSGFTIPVFTDTGPDATNLEAYTALGLAQGTAHWFRARHIASDGRCSLWSTGATASTDSRVPFPIFESPIAGERVAGAAYAIAFTTWGTPGSPTYDLDYTDDNGATWTALLTGSGTPAHTWDTTVFTDGGDFGLRARTHDGGDTSQWNYVQFPIDNGAAMEGRTNDDMISQGDLTQHTPLWDEDNNLYQLARLATPDARGPSSDGAILGTTVFSGAIQMGALQDTSLSELAATLDIYGRFMIGGGEGGYSWGIYIDTELASAGVGAAFEGTLTPLLARFGIGVALRTGIVDVTPRYFSPIDCFNLAKSEDSFLEIHWFDILGNAKITSIPTTAHVNAASFACGKYPWYGVRLRLELLSVNPNGTGDYRARAMLVGWPDVPDAPSRSHQFGWQIDTTITQLPLRCGGTGYLQTQTVGLFSAHTGWRALTNVTVAEVTAADCTGCPDQPSLTAAPNCNDVTLTSSAFSHLFAPPRTHKDSKWQVDVIGGNFTSPFYDSGWDATNKIVSPVIGSLTESTSYLARVAHRDDLDCFVWSDPIPFVTPSCTALPCPSRSTPIRFEVWTDLEAAGGTRVAFIPDVLTAVEKEELGAREMLTITIPFISPAWPQILERRVVRVVYDDDDFKEWPIQEVDRQRGKGDERTVLIECEAAWYRLRESTVKETQTDGTVLLAFGRFNLLPIDMVKAILGFTPAYFVPGNITSTQRTSLDFTNASPLGLLNALAQQLDQELYILKEPGPGNTSYQIHIVDEIGATCPEFEIRYRKNELQIQRELDVSDLATRVCLVGGSLDAAVLTIANAEWTIKSVDVIGPQIVELHDFPILKDDQLNTLWLEQRYTGIRFQVMDTDEAAQTVTLSTTAGLVAGDIVRFLADAGGTELTYLEDPVGVTTYGVVNPPQDTVDIAFGDNLMPNAYLSNWTYVAAAPEYPSAFGQPVDWQTVPATGGSVTVHQEDPNGVSPADPDQSTLSIHVLNGSTAAFVTAATGEGIESLWTQVFPLTPNRVFFSVQAALLLTSGEVRMEIDLDDGTGTITTIVKDPDGNDVTTDVLNRFVTDLGHFGLDLTGTQFVRVRFAAFGGPATFFLDSVMLTQTPGGLVEFVEGLQSNQLWFESNRVLALRGLPEIRYRIPVKDVNRQHPLIYPFDSLNLGGSGGVKDPPLGIDERLRIVAATRDLLHEGITQVDVSNRNEGLARFLARERFASRRGVSRTGNGGGNPPPGSGTGQLSNIQVIERVAGIHQVKWAHNNEIETATAGRFTLTIVERIYTGAGFTTLQATFTIATGRDPKLDSVTTLVGAGSIDAAHGLGATTKRYTYEIQLYDAAVLVNTYWGQIERDDYGVLP